jgi:hypothetical protein
VKPLAGPDNESQEAFQSIKSLLKAGLELGVPEAIRRSALLQPLLGDAADKKDATVGDALNSLLATIKQEPQGLFQIAKEVWSRGGSKDKEKAAEAVGKGLGFLVPHRALQVAKELASMARNNAEAELVGRAAIEPILERAPAMLDRVKQLVTENQKLIRQAALAGLIAYVGRKRKLVALGAEVLLLVAEEHEKEIRDFVRKGLRQLMAVDAKATVKAVADWAKSNPSADRVALAAAFVKKAAGDARTAVEKTVVGAVARLSNGHGAAKTPPKAKTAKSGTKRKTTRKSAGA